MVFSNWAVVVCTALFSQTRKSVVKEIVLIYPHFQNKKSEELPLFFYASLICLQFGHRLVYNVPCTGTEVCSHGRTITCEGGNSNMRVVGRIRLEEFASQHADVRAQLDAWLCEVEEADWKAPSDVKVRFPSASILSDERIVFNLKGNRYRLEVKFSYAVKTVLIKGIGTHAEYSKWTF